MYPGLSTALSNEQQFRLNKIKEIEENEIIEINQWNYFVAEIKERELMSKRISKYIASFEYLDKSLIVLSVTTGSISIASFATVIEAPVGMMSASCSLAVSITTGVVKLLKKVIKNNKK